ncbi:MAG: polysaccharide biosynthesis C-terminal domain-containing protein [Saprospiraceae bacterium]
MGVIKRQGFKFTIVSFIGVVCGVISTLYIYPHALEMVGLFRALYDASILASILVLFGGTISSVKFFPKYRDETGGNKGFLTWILLISGGAFIFFILLFPFLGKLFSNYIFSGKNAAYKDFIIYLIPLTFVCSFTNLLSRYIANFKRIVMPAILENLIIKITFPLIVFMYWQGWINAHQVILGVTLSFAFGLLATGYYLHTLGQFKLTRPEIARDKEAKKEYFNYSGYGILAGIGSQIAFRIDGLMVSAMIQLSTGGLYSISWAVSDMIGKPMRALGSISSPIIAHHLEHGNTKDLLILYRKSSLNMTIIGLGIFLFIWTVLPFIFDLMSNSEVMRQGLYVVFFLGLAQVWDMMTGVNNEIILYSKYYRFNLYLILLLAGLNICTNLLLIPRYGMMGAAIATCISYFSFNLAKLIFIYFKFGFQPLSIRLLPVIVFGIGAWLLAVWLPPFRYPIFSIALKGSVFCMVYGLTVWQFHISPDINQWIEMALGRVTNFLGTKSSKEDPK